MCGCESHMSATGFMPTGPSSHGYLEFPCKARYANRAYERDLGQSQLVDPETPDHFADAHAFGQKHLSLAQLRYDLLR